MSVIKFGTDGWRAKMGEDFSFKNVRVFSQAFSNHIQNKFSNKELSILVNYDTRFLSGEFAQESARIFSLNGIKVYMPERDAPLAPVSLAVQRYKCCGAINFTAGFDKPIYNGIKIFTHKGVPALPEETDLIEQEIEAVEKTFHFKPCYPDSSLIHSIDIKSDYIDYLSEFINFKIIKDSGIKIVVDNLYGTSREYLDYVLSLHGVENVSIHNFPYASFGGVVSSCDSDHLNDLSKLVIAQKADLGMATDIVGDRFGIVDSRGRFLDSNIIMPPLIEYLITVREMEGGIVKSVSTTTNIRKVAEYYLRKVYTTPVGFKFLAKVLQSRKVFIAVESSNGASLNNKIKIKDGMLFSLLVAEMLAHYKLDFEKIIKDFYLRFPHFYNREISVRKDKKTAERLKQLLAQESFDFGPHNLKLKRVDYIDGIKFRFADDSWLLIRESGTNPVVRVYAEAAELKQVNMLIKLGRSLIE